MVHCNMIRSNHISSRTRPWRRISHLHLSRLLLIVPLGLLLWRSIVHSQLVDQRNATAATAATLTWAHLVPPIEQEDSTSTTNNKRATRTSIRTPSTTGTTTTVTAALCAIVKSEEAYLDEWIDYHLAIGFGHIYLYDNSHFFELQQWAVEQSPQQVTVRHLPGNGQQPAAYRACTQQLQQENTFDYVAYLDVDELLWLGDDHERVQDYILDVFWPNRGRGAVSLNWLHLGSSGRRVYEPKPVAQRFRHEMPDAAFVRPGGDGRLALAPYFTKTIARVQDVNVTGDLRAHYVTLLPPHERIDTQGNVLPPAAHMNRNVSHQRGAVVHYRTRSAQEYRQKYERGRVSPVSVERENYKSQFRQMAQLGYGFHAGERREDRVWNLLQKLMPIYSQLFHLEDDQEEKDADKLSGPNSAAVCAMLQTGDEAYLDEWVDYHHAMGFSKFYLLDYSPTHVLQQWGDEKGPHVRMMHSQHISKIDAKSKQRWVQNCQVRARQHQHDWLALLEVNQFLVLRNGQDTVVDFLSRYEQESEVGIFQYKFGTSHRRIYQPKPVTLRFPYREPELEETYTNFLKVISDSPDANHTPTTIVDTDHVPISLDSKSNTDKMRAKQRPSNVAVVHHYQTRSQKEWLVQQYGFYELCRDGAENNTDILNVFAGQVLEPGSVHDDVAWQILKERIPRYALYEQLWTHGPTDQQNEQRRG